MSLVTEWHKEQPYHSIITSLFQSNQTKNRSFLLDWQKYFMCNPKIGVPPSDVLLNNNYFKKHEFMVW